MSYLKSCADIYVKLFLSIFLYFSKFCPGCLENFKLVLLIRFSYKKRVSSTFKAHWNNFLPNKTVTLVSRLYVLIDARNQISKIIYWLPSSLVETESLSDTKVQMLRWLSGIIETGNMIQVALKYMPNFTPGFLWVS